MNDIVNDFHGSFTSKPKNMNDDSIVSIATLFSSIMGLCFMDAAETKPIFDVRCRKDRRCVIVKFSQGDFRLIDQPIKSVSFAGRY